MASAEKFDGRQAQRLTGEIDAMYEGFGDVEAVAAAFDEAVVLVPTIGGDEIVVGLEGGIRWVSAFSSLRELAGFARTAPPDGADRGYLAVRGDRLRAVLAGSANGPFGIAVDPSGTRPWVFLPAEEVAAQPDPRDDAPAEE